MWIVFVCVCARLGWILGKCTKIKEFAHVWPRFEPYSATILNTGQGDPTQTAMVIVIMATMMRVMVMIICSSSQTNINNKTNMCVLNPDGKQ